jgi:hypothetical protein
MWKDSWGVTTFTKVLKDILQNVARTLKVFLFLCQRNISTKLSYDVRVCMFESVVPQWYFEMEKRVKWERGGKKLKVKSALKFNAIISFQMLLLMMTILETSFHLILDSSNTHPENKSIRKVDLWWMCS